jgi:TrmH family RNA methyltransferase
MRISSTDNPLARRLRRYGESSRACREAGRSIVEGLHLVEAALAAGISISAVVVSEAANAAACGLARRAADSAGTRVVEFASSLFDQIAPVEHGTGILAEIVIARPELPQRLSVDAVFLDGVQDPGNAGTLLRSAAAAGVRHVAASSGTAFLWAPKALRAAMGAHFALSIYEDVAVDDLADAFTGERLAADAHGSETLFTAAWGDKPTLWLFGSEGRGLSEESAVVAQRRLRIPVAAGVESLNVAAAAAVCLFEQVRRRASSLSTTDDRAGSPA